MQFKINGQVRSAGIDYAVKATYDGGRIDTMIRKLASDLSDEDYRELCHQLHGTKSEFDEVDGECSVGRNLEEKKVYTVYSALYRGIYWATMEVLDELDLEAMEADEDQD